MTEEKKIFRKSMWGIALPVTMQSMLQSSFGVMDQLMTGQLGSTSIAGIGLAGKFVSLHSVLVSAVAAVAGIMMAQYVGKKDRNEVKKSFFLNLTVALLFAVMFLAVSRALPEKVMSLYSEDMAARREAAQYLKITAMSFIPMAVSVLCATLLRCLEKAALPLYAAIFSAIINTGLNYILIFGKFGFPKMGVKGAAWATVWSQMVCCLITIGMLMVHVMSERREEDVAAVSGNDTKRMVQYAAILFPILICEFLWCLGENVYAVIYGRIGTQACAAMTLTGPVQMLFMGAMSGLAQAAGILTGRTLGSGEKQKAYEESQELMRYGLNGSMLLSVAVFLLSGIYVRLYSVEPQVQKTAWLLLIVFALIAPVKVQNMILGGGILRSGGKTKYIMWIDIIGTWGFGVPLGLLAAFVWGLPIPFVYFILSMEECVRFGISLVIFCRGRWMNCL